MSTLATSSSQIANAKTKLYQQMATCDHTCPLKPHVHIENHMSSHATPIFMCTLATNASEITNAKTMKNKASAYV